MSAEHPCYVCGDEVQWHPMSDDFGICSGCGAEHTDPDLLREKRDREWAENPEHGAPTSRASSGKADA
jgi:hypothetical protein